MDAPELGLMHFWQAGDAVTRSVAWLLLAMSVASWGVIFWKARMSWRIRASCAIGLPLFWQSASLEEGVATLQRTDPEGLFFPMAARLQALRSPDPATVSVGSSAGPGEETTRVLREEMQRAILRVEAGLTLLASVGSTAPFIGLFGTVWGIYHALIAIASSGQVAIERIAGPVGEALIMTAAGLAVAIPAVLAYNAFTRLNRATLASLDGFAHDLAALGR